MRTRIYRALQSSLGDVLPPVRWTKDLLLFVNDMVGRPLSSREEIAERREQRVKGRTSRPVPAPAPVIARPAPVRPVAVPRKPARPVPPVTIYTDHGSRRELGRIVNVLRHRAIPYRELDVERDHATRSWLMNRLRSRELPVVFIGGEPVGGYHELVRLDVSGRLARIAHRP